MILLAGPAGCGKSLLATNYLGLSDKNYWISSDLPWGDGYTGQRVAIFDELRRGTMKFEKLLRLLDRYKIDIPVKGSFTPFTPDIIFITGPRIPDQEFVFHDRWNQQDLGKVTEYEDISQLIRRCDEIRVWDSVRGQWTWTKGLAHWDDEERYIAAIKAGIGR